MTALLHITNMESYLGCALHVAEVQWGLQKLEKFKTNNLRVAQSIMEDNETFTRLKAAKYDLVLRDALSWPALLPAEILGLPTVDVLTTPAIFPLFAPRYSIPNPVAYIPQMISTFPPNSVRFYNGMRQPLTKRRSPLRKTLLGPADVVVRTADEASNECLRMLCA